jgi:uncharacterized protein
MAVDRPKVVAATEAESLLLPLVRFFLLAYGVSWLIWTPLWLPAIGVAGLPVLPYHHALGGLGPMIAAIICTADRRGVVGVRALLRSMVDLRAPLHLAIAVLSPFLLLIVAMLVGDGSFASDGIWHNREFPEMAFPVFVLYNVVFFGFGEEVGWRGFVLPRLQQRMNALGAAVLLSLFWAAWHWPLFLYRPSYMTMGVPGAIGWVLSLLTGSVLLTWLFNGSRGSLLVVAIFHATVDIAFTGQAATPAVVGIMGLLITVWGIATVVVLRPRDLSRRERFVET